MYWLGSNHLIFMGGLGLILKKKGRMVSCGEKKIQDDYLGKKKRQDVSVEKKIRMCLLNTYMLQTADLNTKQCICKLI